MRLLGLSGSIRRGSFNSALIGQFGEALPLGATLTTFPHLALIPPFDEDRDGRAGPGVVERLRVAIATADALLIATPEFNGSVPGVLKNAVDWASRPWPENCLRAKPVLVVGASTSIFGAIWAQADLRRILRIAGADVLDAEVAVAQAHLVFDRFGGLSDPVVVHAVHRAAASLIEHWAGRAARAERPDCPTPDPATGATTTNQELPHAEHPSASLSRTAGRCRA